MLYSGGMNRLIGSVAIACLFVVSGPAHAEPEARAEEKADKAELWTGRPWSLAFHLALAAPAGTVAAEIERSLTSYLSIAGGVGLAQGGRQWAGMLRLRKVMRADFALGVGVGVSHGDYENLAIFPEPFEHIENVTWLNGEAYYEARTRSSFLVRVYAGASQMVDAGPHRRDPEASTTILDTLPYAGVALGVTF